MSAETLLPCPFCGDEATRDRSLRNGRKDGEPNAWVYYVRCPSCQATGGYGNTAASADYLWNNRATPPDGPCVWIARFGLTGGYAAYSTHLYLTEPEKMDVHGEVCWPSGGVQLPTDMAGTLGLAPGECKRFRLVPEGGSQ